MRQGVLVRLRMCVRVSVPMRVVVAAVGAALGLERLVVVHDGEAELRNHRVEHVVREVAHPAGADLERRRGGCPSGRRPARGGVGRGTQTVETGSRAATISSTVPSGSAQLVAAAQHRAARQLNADLGAGGEMRALPAFCRRSNGSTSLSVSAEGAAATPARRRAGRCCVKMRNCSFIRSLLRDQNRK